MNETQKTALLRAVSEASERWKNAFNRGDAAACTEQYEADAVMHARPFGTFSGHAEIRSFWQQLIDDGFGEVEYLQPIVEAIDARTALLTSGWKMNKAAGVIHREIWVLQEDGSARLREDDFEARG